MAVTPRSTRLIAGSRTKSGPRCVESMQAFYDQFVEKVAEARHTTPEKIDQMAQGRVWTGQQARQVGLVDQLGGLQVAIAVAKQRARIPAEEEVDIVVYPPRRSFYDVSAKRFAVASRRGTELNRSLCCLVRATAAFSARCWRPPASSAPARSWRTCRTCFFADSYKLQVTSYKLSAQLAYMATAPRTRRCFELVTCNL